MSDRQPTTHPDHPIQSQSPAKRTKGTFGITYLFIIIAVAVIGAMLFSQRGASMPGYLDHSNAEGGADTIQAAMERAATDGKPVLVFATAEWCGPCQVLKRGDLSKPEVEQTLTENYELFVLDLTSQDDPEAQRLAQMLRVEAIPTMLILRDGAVVEGGRWTPRSGSFASWIASKTTGAAANASPAG